MDELPKVGRGKHVQCNLEKLNAAVAMLLNFGVSNASFRVLTAALNMKIRNAKQTNLRQQLPVHDGDDDDGGGRNMEITPYTVRIVKHRLSVVHGVDALETCNSKDVG